MFMLSGFSGVVLLQFKEGFMIPVLVMSCKFGIAAAFNVIYILTSQMFRPAVSATAFGTCNFFARVATVIAPFVAEMPEPVPIVALSITCFCASTLIFGVKKAEETREKECEIEVD